MTGKKIHARAQPILQTADLRAPSPSRTPNARSPRSRVLPGVAGLAPKSPQRQIGFAMQPATYLAPRSSKALLAAARSPLQGGFELLQRAAQAEHAGSHQGFVGTLSSAYAGHTLLHSKATLPDGTVVRRSTGFSPDGLFQSALVGAGAPVVDGAFHDETGVEHDSKSVALTRPVGPGVHAGFQALQDGLPGAEHQGYSFRPDRKTSQNCLTAALTELHDFVGHAQQHVGLMGELQSACRRVTPDANPAQRLQAVVDNQGDRHYSHNQNAELSSFNGLNNLMRNLEHIVEDAAKTGRGNQGLATAFAKRKGGTHGNM